MKESKGWEFLTAFEEIDEKYIYQAAKPWKENKIVIVQHYIRAVSYTHLDVYKRQETLFPWL